MILLETHAHSSPASSCGHVAPQEVARLIKSNGYDAMVLTNHFVFDKNRDYDQSFDTAVADYAACKKMGEALGFPVFFGLELRFLPSINDYLIYGFTPESFYAMGSGFETLEDFFGQMPDGTLLYQAHPYRPHMVRANPRFLHGAEVYNGHPRHQSRNSLAAAFCTRHKLYALSGSDMHQAEDVARGGMYLDHMPKDSPELAGLLKTVDIKRLKKG